MACLQRILTNKSHYASYNIFEKERNLRSAIAEEFDLTALEKDSKLGGQVQLGSWDPKKKHQKQMGKSQ